MSKTNGHATAEMKANYATEKEIPPKIGAALLATLGSAYQSAIHFEKGNSPDFYRVRTALALVEEIAKFLDVDLADLECANGVAKAMDEAPYRIWQSSELSNIAFELDKEDYPVENQDGGFVYTESLADCIARIRRSLEVKEQKAKIKAQNAQLAAERKRLKELEAGAKP